MPRRAFLSFVEEDLDLVRLFRGQAQNENTALEFSDYSVREPFDSTNANYIRAQITELIRVVSVTICLIGRQTYTSSWVSWEIDSSVKLGKGLVGVRLHGDARDIVPSSLVAHAAEIVDWNIKQITAAIERAAKGAGY